MHAHGNHWAFSKFLLSLAFKEPLENSYSQKNQLLDSDGGCYLWTTYAILHNDLCLIDPK